VVVSSFVIVVFVSLGPFVLMLRILDVVSFVGFNVAPSIFVVVAFLFFSVALLFFTIVAFSSCSSRCSS
jgi:hypothetical protein